MTMINLAIVGSRTFNDYELLKQHIEPTNIAAIVSGGARGADTLAEQFAEEHSIQMIVFKPDYEKHGRSAPFVRNTAIIEAADSVIAFWDGKSTGTLDSIKKARKLGKSVTVIEYLRPSLDF